MKRRDAVPIGIGSVTTLIAFAVLAPMIVSDGAWPTTARDFLADHGFARTGAENVVSAIYLGFRAYDTVGETVVLLAALIGAVALIAGARSEQHGEAPEIETRETERKHTHIVDTVAGKLSPIILLFGFYLMLFGHLSPGGGFQGGVIVSSGIVFLAIGRGAVKRRAFSPTMLARTEGVAFIGILILAFPAVRGAGAGIGSVTSIILLNVAIGLKVGSGIALFCLLLLATEGT